MNKKPDERQDRITKLQKLQQEGINPYPAAAQRDYRINDILADFNTYARSEERLYLAGRIRSIRSHGNLTFVDLQDESGRIQLVFNKKIVGADAYKAFTTCIDNADFISVSGKAFITQAGQQSLEVGNWNILTKALRSLPDEYYGFKDEEERLRKRYLDILLNPEQRRVIELKGKFWNAVRTFLLGKGFLEIETPVLETTTGGADARPFVTHHNALDMDVYLRISAGELWQKRLMVAGFEKTFEIGRVFRNEGISPEHGQDYTQMEFYWAYADYERGMQLVEELYKYVAQEVFGTLQFKIRGFDVDLSQPWERYDYRETVQKFTGVDILTASLKEIEAKLKELGVNYDQKGFNITRAIDNLWKYCRRQIGGPGFLINVPAVVSPLAKPDPNNLQIVQQFQPLIAGSELGKGYSELNDPLQQAERFREQQALRDAGDDEAQMADWEFVEALEHGMPPTCGFGMSERVFSFLMDKTLRECQTFPLLRPKEESNK